MSKIKSDSYLCQKCLNTGEYWNGEEMEECPCGQSSDSVDNIFKIDLDTDDDIDIGGSLLDDDFYPD